MLIKLKLYSQQFKNVQLNDFGKKDNLRDFHILYMKGNSTNKGIFIYFPGQNQNSIYALIKYRLSTIKQRTDPDPFYFAIKL